MNELLDFDDDLNEEDLKHNAIAMDQVEDAIRALIVAVGLHGKSGYAKPAPKPSNPVRCSRIGWGPTQNERGHLPQSRGLGWPNP